MKRMTLFAGVAAVALSLSACGSGSTTTTTTTTTTTDPVPTGTVDNSIPSASKAPAIAGIKLSSSNGSGTISTYTDVIAKCTFVYSGTINKTVVAARAENNPGTAQAYIYTSDTPSSISGSLSITATCQNDKGSSTKRLLN